MTFTNQLLLIIAVCVFTAGALVRYFDYREWSAIGFYSNYVSIGIALVVLFYAGWFVAFVAQKIWR